MASPRCSAAFAALGIVILGALLVFHDQGKMQIGGLKTSIVVSNVKRSRVVVTSAGTGASKSSGVVPDEALADSPVAKPTESAVTTSDDAKVIEKTTGNSSFGHADRFACQGELVPRRREPPKFSDPSVQAAIQQYLEVPSGSQRVGKELRDLFLNAGADHIQTYIVWDRSSFGTSVFNAKDLERIQKRLRKRRVLNYPDDRLLYKVMEEWPQIFKDKHAMIPGSEKPHYELLLYELWGAKNVSTVDYRKFTTADPRINVELVADFWKAPYQFDSALSWSNFEHDGLGRYGDPVNPDGDLDAVREIWSLLKPGGYLVVAVPASITGKFEICLNKHRQYNDERLANLAIGYEVIARYRALSCSFSPSAEHVPCANDGGHTLLVLQKRCGTMEYLKDLAKTSLQRAAPNC